MASTEIAFAGGPADGMEFAYPHRRGSHRVYVQTSPGHWAAWEYEFWRRAGPRALYRCRGWVKEADVPPGALICEIGADAPGGV